MIGYKLSPFVLAANIHIQIVTLLFDLRGGFEYYVLIVSKFVYKLSNSAGRAGVLQIDNKVTLIQTLTLTLTLTLNPTLRS